MPTTTMSVDESQSFQTLLGFGATLGLYAEEQIAEHADKEAIFDAMFEESGLDALRLVNRYEAEGQTDVSLARDVVLAAEERLGREPLVLLTSKSPPAALKQNGTRECTLSDPAGCTLIDDGAGSFDYAAFSAHWLASVEAYQAAGVSVGYLSIQDNPNYLPPEGEPGWACHFLPVEGSATFTTDSGDVTADFPGLTEAIEAVDEALTALSGPPRLMAPEGSGARATVDFASEMDLSRVDALAHHLYGLDVQMSIDPLLDLGALGQSSGLPVFQTEMRAEGAETARLMHHSLVSAGAAVYVQNDFVAVGVDPESERDPAALLSLLDEGLFFELPYYVMGHFARFTDPGFVRVAVDCGDPALLCTAWLAPDDEALTVVILNEGDQEHRVGVELSDDLAGALEQPRAHRTVFSGVERGSDLGTVAEGGAVVVPPGSLVTLAWTP